MVAAKADGKAKIAAQLQMRPMPIQRVVCEFLLIDCYDGDGDGETAMMLMMMLRRRRCVRTSGPAGS